MEKMTFLKKWYIRLTQFKWIVGIAEFDNEVVINPAKRLTIHWIKKIPKNSWFADTIILDETDNTITLLVEEYFYSNHKGRISKLVVNRITWCLEQIIPIIDIETHLSFPVYYRLEDKVFIYPESTKSGSLTLYEYNDNEGSAKPVAVICNYPLADAVILKIQGRNYLMATTSPMDNGKILDFYPLDDPYSGPEFKVAFKTNVARNAGLPFIVDNRLFRPAQDCTKSYGSCVVIQELTVKDKMVDFKDIKRFKSPLLRFHEGFHTFNVFNNKLVAVDAEGFRYGFLAQIIHLIRELFRR